MAPNRVLCATGAALGLMAAPSLFVQPSASRQGALRGVEQQGVTQQPQAVARATQQGGDIPLSGIVGPSLVGAVAIGAALTSLSSSSSSSRKTARTATAAETAPPPAAWDVTKEMGVGPPPIGFFDPLGFTKGKDEEGFRKLRCAEMKHGRVAMMASIGAVFQHFVKFPGFEDIKGTFGALNYPAGFLGFIFLSASCSILELAWRERPDSMWAGDYNDPLGLKMYDDDMRNKEINNGRMAMISVLAIFVAELASGKDAMEQFGL